MIRLSEKGILLVEHLPLVPLGRVAPVAPLDPELQVTPEPKSDIDAS